MRLRRLRKGGCVQSRRGQDLFQFACAHHGIHFRDALLDLIAIAFDQAPGDDQLAGAPARLELGHFEDGIDGLLLGFVDERAGVDDQDVSGFRLIGDLRPRAVEEPHHDFRVDEIFGAAQADEAYARP